MIQISYGNREANGQKATKCCDRATSRSGWASRAALDIAGQARALCFGVQAKLNGAIGENRWALADGN